ncbi:DeoR/GlpR family DNA-binding transcription regulator [Bifidobacterium aquikefiri]|uniref:Transcriptional regulator n=2 Tax=Bifidobacterium aquikefiri TaxID=1653207 RepID=A0A261G822_9BIFI|nr:DeoR/GlpR family DNA-binding transcription regulator [Bifidobacterium aquikefiri]OZG67572.1 transcriptional regulator [Bifidobacterium aquikefiri]
MKNIMGEDAIASEENQLIPAQRQQIIIDLLHKAGVATIKSLVERFGVSHMTIRRDIAALEQSGRVISTPGGVKLTSWISQAPPRGRTERSTLEMPRKRAIAQQAGELIQDNMMLIIDAGTTCQALTPFLVQRRGVCVVTNDFYVVDSLFTTQGISVIHTGGAVDSDSRSSSGVLATKVLEEINADLYFMSSGAWNLDDGVTTTSTDKVQFKQAAMRSATATCLIADSTKYGVRESYRVAALDELDEIITDDDLSQSAQSDIAQGQTAHITLVHAE